MPAGPIEEQLDELGAQTTWEKFLAFLESAGVDVQTARDADIHISAGVARGTILVTNFVKDETGVYMLTGEGEERTVVTVSNEYVFEREGL